MVHLLNVVLLRENGWWLSKRSSTHVYTKSRRVYTFLPYSCIHALDRVNIFDDFGGFESAYPIKLYLSIVSNSLFAILNGFLLWKKRYSASHSCT